MLAPSAKKIRLSDLKVAPNVPLSAVHSILKQLGATSEHAKTFQRKASVSQVDVQTPYGQLIEHVQLPCFDGSFLSLAVANPFALLYQLCKLNPGFSKLLEGGKPSTGDGLHRLAFYSDETSAGNVLHPDTPKEVQTLYWTLHEIPSWMRARAGGWMNFGYLKTSEQELVKGGLGGVWKATLRRFFMPDGGFNFKQGVLLPKCGGGTFLLKAKVGAMPQDEKAIKGTWGVKGASGTRCCIKCKNVVSTDPVNIAGSSYLKHVALAMPEDLDLQSDTEFWRACDRLHAAALQVEAGTLTKTDFKAMEKSCGITYDPDALPYDVYLRDYIGISSVYFDWMHSVCASGGVGQYVLNAFVQVLLHENDHLTLEDLDQFCRRIIWPPGRELPKDFFQNRINMKEGTHLKAFAGEVITATRALSFFAEETLLPKGIMPEHCRCLQMLQAILDILALGDEAVERADQLQDLLVAHHKLALKLYGAGVLKVKPHLMLHVPGQFKLHEVNFSCFPMERKHKTANKAGARQSGMHFQLGILRVCCREQLHQIQEHPAQKFYLLEPCFEASALEPILPSVAGLLPGTPSASKSMQTGCGVVKVGFVLLFVVGGRQVIGVAQCFASCSRPVGLDLRYLALVSRCDEVSPGAFAPTSQLMLVDASDLKAVLAYGQSGGNKIRPLLPATCR